MTNVKIVHMECKGQVEVTDDDFIYELSIQTFVKLEVTVTGVPETVLRLLARRVSRSIIE